MRLSLPFLLMVLPLVLATGCPSRPLEQARTGTLSERVGGHAGIDKIVAALVRDVPNNQQLKAPFETVDMQAFRTNFAGFLCGKIGASCATSPQQTEALYTDLSFTSHQYGAFMELFIASMNEADLPQKEQNDLLDAVMQLEAKIVKQ